MLDTHCHVTLQCRNKPFFSAEQRSMRPRPLGYNLCNSLTLFWVPALSTLTSLIIWRWRCFPHFPQLPPPLPPLLHLSHILPTVHICLKRPTHLLISLILSEMFLSVHSDKGPTKMCSTGQSAFSNMQYSRMSLNLFWTGIVVVAKQSVVIFRVLVVACTS